MRSWQNKIEKKLDKLIERFEHLNKENLKITFLSVGVSTLLAFSLGVFLALFDALSLAPLAFLSVIIVFGVLLNLEEKTGVKIPLLGDSPRISGEIFNVSIEQAEKIILEFLGRKYDDKKIEQNENRIHMQFGREIDIDIKQTGDKKNMLYVREFPRKLSEGSVENILFCMESIFKFLKKSFKKNTLVLIK